MPTFTFLILSNWTAKGHKKYRGAGGRRRTAIAEAEKRKIKVMRAEHTFGRYDIEWQVELDGANAAGCKKELLTLWKWFHNQFGHVEFKPTAKPPSPRIINIT
jgi:uncharacterized protein with GYD domain